MEKPFKFAAAVKLWSGLLAGLLAPSLASACACGCGIFDVGTSSMFPNGEGGTAYLQYDYQDQNQNWSGTSSAPAANNTDREIQTQFVTLGYQYLFNRSWGIQAEVPYGYRTFKADDGTGQILTRSWNQLGDIRVRGLYTGFFPDMSAGITFGLKLPTGSHLFAPEIVDRDTQLGTGSTDIMLGGFDHGDLTKDGNWGWFAQLQLDVPALIQAQYRPGLELDTAAGIDFKGLVLGRVHIVPLAQVIFSERTSDSDAAADPANTGYQRLLLAPGLELDIHPVKLYADVEFPVWQHLTGNQLVAPLLVKVSLSYMF